MLIRYCTNHLKRIPAIVSAMTVVMVVAAHGAGRARPAVQVANALPSHPRLLLNSNGVAELKHRIATAPWAKAAWAELQAGAEKSLADPVMLPPRGGNWSHNYVCPTHGARLSRGDKLGTWRWEHICPAGPHALLGDPSEATLDFDGNAISSVHAQLARQIVDHGLVFQVAGDKLHAAKAREILLAYADRYLTYPLHDNRGKRGQGGHVASQSLTEAGWLIAFTQGADLVWTTLSDADRAAITEKVLMPALQEVILPRRLGIHNIQCHHNSAIGLVGFLLGDEKLISQAIDDPERGYRKQMAKGVLDDGMWLEGSSGYHFFTVSGVLPLTEASRNCGRAIYGPKLQSMFDGPLALAMPDFVLPNFNDSRLVPLSDRADLYELALARYGNPTYAGALAQSDRSGKFALLCGVVDLPSGAAASPLASRNSPASGYAILQKSQGTEATWLCAKYGAHGGGHGHPDKNTFILYARGQVVSPDAGTHAYASPLHSSWDRTTLAHNTLTVDETSQSQATGQCLVFGNQRGVDYVMTDAGPIYSGVRFVRTVAMLTSNLVVFVDQVTCDKPRTLDLVYHQNGDWGKLPSGESWNAPLLAGYKRFTDTTKRSVVTGLTLDTMLAKNWHSTVTLAGGEPTEVITGYGILKTTEDCVPMLVQRRRAERTAFVWAVSLDGAPVELQTERVSKTTVRKLSEDEAVLVNIKSGGRQWSLLANPEQKSIKSKRPDGTIWRTSAAVAIQ